MVWTDGSSALLSDCSLNDGGLAVFPLTFSSPEGLYFYDGAGGTSGLLTNRPIGSTAWTGAEVNATGQTAFRASFSGQHAWVSFDGETNPPFHALEVGLEPTSPYWYLYTPSFNDQRLIAGKTSLAANHDADQIIVCDDAAVCTAIIEDVDADPGSAFSSFQNSVSLTNTGLVAFNAGLVGGGSGVFLTDGSTVTTIATTAMPEISSIDYFAPRANDHGRVVFRAFDGAGLMAIFVGDGTSLARVVTEHDLVPTDLGEGRIDQHDGGRGLRRRPRHQQCRRCRVRRLAHPAGQQPDRVGLRALHRLRRQDLRRWLRVRQHRGLVRHLTIMEFVPLWRGHPARGMPLRPGDPRRPPARETRAPRFARSCRSA